MSQWLTSGGGDQCPFCETDYHQQTGYYCWNCDSPLCTTCVTPSKHSSAWLCPDCAASESEQAQDKHAEGAN